MRVMVTGGAGYIGSVVTDELRAEGHSVTVIDNCSKGHHGAVSEDVEFVTADICDYERICELLTHYRIQAVVHLAAFSQVGESASAPDKYYRNNVTGTLSLLNAMTACGVRLFVFSSTAAVYGEPLKQPIEEGDPTLPTNPYGETKLAIEKALPWYEAAFGLRYASLRYFNAAGATALRGEFHNPETHLIPILLQIASKERAYFELYGDDYPTIDGTCIRDFIHVADIARAHVQVLRNLSDRSVTYNLGSAHGGHSVLEVIRAVKDVTGADIPVRVAPRRTGDPPVLIANSDKITRELHWISQFDSIHSIVDSAWQWKLSHPQGYARVRA